MFTFLLLLSSLILTGAAISSSYQIFPPLGFLSSLGSNVLFGGISGALLAGGIALIWKRSSSVFEDEHIAVRLANSLWVGLGGAVLIATDYNLNRVAQVEGVSILNIHELTSAVKPQFIPGEDLSVEIIDRGEEINQGIGYLDDGTMVVVDNGRQHIGRTIKTVVKSTLQTDAGRMLFVEPAGEHSRWER